MKKKKLTGKLSLEKSKISALESSKIFGGATVPCTGLCIPTSLQQGGCVTDGCTVTENPTGSECECE
ncbi:MAG: hypothetical protein IIC74_10655 [Bacteroidetes bacterium]|nr:hypothetical protein [Bacteroidota bacterium]